MKKVLDGSHERAVVDALIYGRGEPEFIEQCLGEFKKRSMMMARKRDQEVSNRNLKAIANFKLGINKTLIFEES